MFARINFGVFLTIHRNLQRNLFGQRRTNFETFRWKFSTRNDFIAMFKIIKIPNCFVFSGFIPSNVNTLASKVHCNSIYDLINPNCRQQDHRHYSCCIADESTKRRASHVDTEYRSSSLKNQHPFDDTDLPNNSFLSTQNWLVSLVRSHRTRNTSIGMMSVRRSYKIREWNEWRECQITFIVSMWRFHDKTCFLRKQQNKRIKKCFIRTRYSTVTAVIWFVSNACLHVTCKVTVVRVIFILNRYWRSSLRQTTWLSIFIFQFLVQLAANVRRWWYCCLGSHIRLSFNGYTATIHSGKKNRRTIEMKQKLSDAVDVWNRLFQ